MVWLLLSFASLRDVIPVMDGSAYPRNSQGVAHKRCLPQSVSVIPDLRSNLSDISTPGFSGSGREGADTARLALCSRVDVAALPVCLLASLCIDMCADADFFESS